MVGTSASRPSGGNTPEWLRYSGASSSSSSAASSLRMESPAGGSGASYRDVLKGKAPASSAEARPQRPRAGGSGFMADARRAHPPPPPPLRPTRHPPPPPPHPARRAGRWPEVDADGFTRVVRRRNWRRLERRPPPRREPRPVPADLVGLCFNCLQPDHMAACCRNPPRCLRCRREGHAARACKRPRSPALDHGTERLSRARGAPSGGPAHRNTMRTLLPHPPPRILRAQMGAMGNGSPAMSPPADSYTPPGSLAASTPSGSQGEHAGNAGPPVNGRSSTSSPGRSSRSSPSGGPPQPPEAEPRPEPDVPGAPHRRPRVEFCIIPWSASIEANEQALGSALVAMVAGTRPVVSPAQVELFMSEHFELGRDDVEVRLYRPDDFLLVFRRRTDADRVLHADPPASSAFRLTFRRWRWEARAVSEPMLFKVLLDMKGIPGHLWELDVAQRIVGSSCLIIQAAPDVESRRNMRTFTVAAWAAHPDLIPEEVVVIVPEKEAPFSPGNLFLRPEELIHSSKSTLRYRVSIEVREVQDWHERSESSSEDRGGRGRSDEDDSDHDDFPRAGNDGRSSKAWPRRHRFSPGNGPGGSTWPTAAGCDSALGWWGHAVAGNTEQTRPAKKTRSAVARSLRRAAPPPRRGQPPRRVWRPRSKLQSGKEKDQEKQKQSVGPSAVMAAQVTSPAEPSLAAAVSPSASPEASDTVGTKGSPVWPLGSMEAQVELVEEDMLPSRHEDSLERWDPMRQEFLACMQPDRVVPAGRVFGRILSVVGPRRSLGPSFESVTFPVAMPVVWEGPATACSTGMVEVDHVTGPAELAQDKCGQDNGEHAVPPSVLAHGEQAVEPARPADGVGSPVRVEPVPNDCQSWSPTTTRFVTTSRGGLPVANDNAPLSDADFADLCTRPLPETVILTSPPRRRPRRTLQESLLPRRSSRIAKKTRGRLSNPVVAAQNVLMRKLGILQPEAEPDVNAVQQYTDLLSNGMSVSDAEAIDTIFPEHVPVDGEVDDDEEPVEV
ncbi:unnamed protein product [Urochloa decumbens]|uniref:CCHC-type domain-containing protein n=1 Tax=Urochloa decumbens TaxID=240449 RepID=A0ABC9D8N5_9POAL